MKKDSSHVCILAFYLVSVAICILALYIVLGLRNFDPKVPFASNGDVRLSSYLCKTLVDNPWCYENKFTGAPDVTLLYDYPSGADNLNIAILKLLALITGNYAATLNLFFLLTFFLIVTTAYFSSVAMGLRPYFSLVLSVLYAFMPYHFLRGESHLFLSSYFCIPISVYLMSIIYGSIDHSQSVQRLRLPVILPLLIIIGSTGIYYAYFSLFLFFTAGIFGFMKTRKKQHIYSMLICCAVVILVLIVNFAPSFLYQISHGRNDAAVSRYYLGAEIYALKISQLFLPMGGHRINAFSRVGSNYNQVISSEGPAYIGLIGIAGFLFLLFSLVPRDKIIQSRERAQIRFLAIQTIASILLATVGGFGALIAYKVFQYIRAYNRISILIAFVSIFCAFLLIQILHNILRSKIRNSIAFLAVSIALPSIFLFLGLLDETSKSYRLDYVTSTAIFENEEEFVQRIESVSSTDAMVFQLPYVPFPENPPVNKMIDYQHFTAYLHSKHIRWSYGAMKGRDTAKRNEAISKLTPENMVDYLCLDNNFSGIYIDLEGYPDAGTELKTKLEKKLNEKPLTSINKLRVFFDLANYRHIMENSMQAANIKIKLSNIVSKLEGRYEIGTMIEFADDLYFGRGWSVNEGSHRWTDGKHAEIGFELGNINAMHQFSLVLDAAMTIGGQRVRASINANPIGEKTINGKGNIDFTFPGDFLKMNSKNTISLDLPDARPPGTGDSRVLGIALGSMIIQETSK